MNSSNRGKFKVIAKNSIYLYVRLLLTVIVTLYLTKVVLDILGVEDFGVYNLVAGLATMLGFLSVSMTNSTQRFISYELGKGSNGDVSTVFSTSINIHIIFSVIIVVIMEFLGLWFIDYKLVIPLERLHLAEVVFHCCAATFLITMVTVPFNSILMAYEKMGVVALLSIIEIFIKLISVLTIIDVVHSEALISYAVLMFVAVFIVKIILIIYCLYNVKIKYRFRGSFSLFTEVLKFSGWNIFGSIAYLVMTQGVSVLLNVFFGPTVNAARAIALQVQSAILQIASSFQLAFNPQIVKSYSSNENSQVMQIALYGAKYSFFLMLFAGLPILFEAESILQLWLNEVPDYTVIFVKLMVINVLVNVLSETLITIVQATGRIKFYQIIVGSLLICNLPLSYIFLEYGASPESTLYVSILISVIALIVRLVILSKMINFDVRKFLSIVILRSALVVFIASFLLLYLHKVVELMEYKLLLLFTLNFFVLTATIFFIGISSKERTYLLSVLKKLRSYV